MPPPALGALSDTGRDRHAPPARGVALRSEVGRTLQGPACGGGGGNGRGAGGRGGAARGTRAPTRPTPVTAGLSHPCACFFNSIGRRRAASLLGGRLDRGAHRLFPRRGSRLKANTGARARRATRLPLSHSREEGGCARPGPVGADGRRLASLRSSPNARAGTRAGLGMPPAPLRESTRARPQANARPGSGHPRSRTAAHRGRGGEQREGSTDGASQRRRGGAPAASPPALSPPRASTAPATAPFRSRHICQTHHRHLGRRAAATLGAAVQDLQVARLRRGGGAHRRRGCDGADGPGRRAGGGAAGRAVAEQSRGRWLAGGGRRQQHCACARVRVCVESAWGPQARNRECARAKNTSGGGGGGGGGCPPDHPPPSSPLTLARAPAWNARHTTPTTAHNSREQGTKVTHTTHTEQTRTTVRDKRKDGAPSSFFLSSASKKKLCAEGREG